MVDPLLSSPLFIINKTPNFRSKPSLIQIKTIMMIQWLKVAILDVPPDGHDGTMSYYWRLNNDYNPANYYQFAKIITIG